MRKTAVFMCLASALMLSAQSRNMNDKESTENKTVDIPQVVYAWKILPPLGLREPASVDTLPLNYGQRSVPSAQSIAYATTGNLGAAGETLDFFDRAPLGQFFFDNALSSWLPSLSTQRFYNSRIPVTFLSYNTGGDKETAQDRLSATFSGNINKRAQIGALCDYIYSRGSYDYQAVKGLTWGFSGSYIGERYEMQAYYNHWNILGMENGGITDDLYITDPAQLQGGQNEIEPKAIPTRLTGAFNRVTGGELYVNNIYKVGYWKEEEVDDTTTVESYVPVTSFSWTLNYKNGKHKFIDKVAADSTFWKNAYFDRGFTDDNTSYWSLSNTIGVSMLEGFNKFAKFGLSAFATYEIRRFTQNPDTLDMMPELPEHLTPYPYDHKVAPKGSENLMWIGGQLTKQHGSILTYGATARFGVAGPVAADVHVDGNVSTRFKLLGDTVTVTGYGKFSNEAAPYLLQHYVSNHFIWENDFGKTRRLRLGGWLSIPHTRTYINVGVENLQNYIYFNSDCMPVQHSGSVQVLSASLSQNFKFGPVHWDNRVLYQTTSEESVIPLPKLSIYSNLYFTFKVARVLDVQIGVDCDYYTKYKSVDYQPATMAFYNQSEIECGNFPFMNAYVNMKLSKTRFYIMMSHINQDMGDPKYFSMPHYPLNPMRFQMGLSIDFAN